MKKLILMMAAILYGVTGWAADTLRIGNCHGELAASGYETTPQNQWIETAMMVSQETVGALKGNEISQVRVGLVNRLNIDTVKVWVRSSLTGENLAEGFVTTRTTPNIKKGWNTISLKQPYAIKDAQPLYVGYSFKQRKATETISVVGDPSANSFFLSDGAAWQDLSGKGSLSVEAVVVGDHLTQYDLGIESATAKMNSSTGVVSIVANLYNYGSQAVTGATLTARLGGTDEHYDYHYAQTIASGAAATVTFTIQPKATGVGTDHIINLEITALDNGTDQDASNNTAPAAFSFARKVLIEEFTGEACPNCPRVAEYLHTTLAKSKYAGLVYAVCHHAGYEEDWLTTEADKKYTWLYNSGTYAPAVMYNRYPFFETTKQLPTPVHNPYYQSDMETATNALLQSDAYAYLTLRAELDPADKSKVKVSVTGQRSKALTTALSCLTVYLTEDHVKAKAQYGSDGKILTDYYHDHVLRAYNSIWGDEINWVDNKFSYTCELTVSDDWDTSNMNVVAFINSYDKTTPGNCAIENVESVSFPTAESAIRSVAGTSAAAATYYNMKGERIQQPMKGLYIERAADGTTRKVVR